MPVDWEALARRGPYFRVLTNDGLLQVESNEAGTAEFWATGESDMAALLAAVAATIHAEVPLAAAMDFGCGAGRLTLPLARRAGSVLACDVAPTMLEHTRRNAEEAGLSNVRVMEAGRLDTMPDARLTFICSLLTFQYIPRSVGYPILRHLLRLLAPGGIAVVQLLLAPPGETLRRLARSRVARPVRPDLEDSLPIYAYDARVVIRAIVAADAHLVARMETGRAMGEVLVIRKSGPTGPA